MIQPLKMIRVHAAGKWIFYSVALLILFSACRVGNSWQQAVGTTSTPEDSVSTEVVSEEAETFEVELSVGPGDFFLTDPRVGLDGLQSYTATLVVTFDGSNSGQTQGWSHTYTIFHTQDPLANQLTITGDVAAEEPNFLAEMNEVAYQIGEDGRCVADLINPEEVAEFSPIQLMEPGALLNSAFGAEAAGSETVNNVPADHYTFDQRALIALGISEASGELWVASDSGVLLKYLLTATADEDFFGEGVEGTMTWDYALTDINTTVQPPMPEACQLGVPLMADAADILHLPYWLAFTTAVPFSDAAAFYQEQLPANGWTLAADPMASESSSFMEFTRADQTIAVFTSAEGGVTQVDVVLYSPEE